MTSSSSLYGSVNTQNTQSTNSTSLYGGADTPIPTPAGDLIVRGDLYVLSGNILTTATTGNIFPTNATTVNLGNAATSVNIGASTGSTTINNNLVVDGTGTFAGDVTATGADFGNITIGIADDQTITTTTGRLVVKSASGEIDTDTTSILSTNSSSFFLLNSPTTVNAFEGATALTMGATSGTTTVRNDLTVQGNATADGATLGKVTVGLGDDQTITTTTGELRLSSVSAAIKLPSVTSIYTDTTGSFGLLNQPTTVNAFTAATALNLGAATGTTNINNNLLIDGTSVSLAQDTGILYSENNDRTNRPYVQSTTGNSSGLRVKAPNATTSAAATLSVSNTNDAANTTFLSLQALGSATDPLRITTGKYTANVFGPSGNSIAVRDGTTTYATLNPAGPTIGSDLTTKTYVDAQIGAVPTYDTNVVPVTGGVELDLRQVDLGYTIVGQTQFLGGTNITVSETAPNIITISGSDLNTTYTIDASTTTGGANFNLAGSDSSIDTIKFANGTNVTVTATDANTISIAATDTNTTYNIDATSTTGGANLNLNGSDSTVDPVAFKGSGATTVTRTDANTITVSSTDTNTTYTQDVSSTTGGANVNLNGSDASVDSVAYKGAGSVTVTATDSSTVTITGTDTNTTYNIDATSTTGGANLNLNGSDSSVDPVAFKGSGATTVTRTDANTVTISSTDTNTTYTQDVSSTTGGANLNLVGSDATTDSVKFAGGTNVSIVATDASTMTINATDTNTTYDFNATATTGGANLNLVGSDSTTDTVKLTNGGHITATYTSGTEVTLGSDATDANTASTIVARDASGNFSAGTITAALNGNATTATTATQVANSLTAGTHLSGGPFNGSAAVTLTTDATDANTAGTIVARDGSGNFAASGATLGAVTVGVDTDQVVSTTSGNLVLQTAAGVNAGTLTLTAGANGAITVAPNGTGSVATTFSNGGNLSSNRNVITGAIRNATTASIGDIWALNATGPVNPLRGVSVDNSSDTSKVAGYVGRTYSNTAGFRSRLVLERARGTAASPTQVLQGDFLGEVGIGGYSSTGWVNDTLPLVPAFFGFNALENWTSNTNLGTTFTLSLLPTATTATSSAQNINVISANPQGYTVRSDAFGIGQGKTAAFVATGCSTSGTTLTIGTVTSGSVAVGQLVQTSINTFNQGTYIVSGSGSTWTLSSSPGTQSALTVTGNTGFIGAPTTATTVDALQDLRLLKNAIKNSAGTTVITTNTTNVAMALPVAFPAYTAAALRAITGAIGWQAAVSDSASGGNPNGMMAFWDTTNARWSYIHDNSAV